MRNLYVTEGGIKTRESVLCRPLGVHHRRIGRCDAGVCKDLGPGGGKASAKVMIGGKGTVQHKQN